MNWIAILIIVFIIAELVLTALADYLNHQSMRPNLPPEFQDSYDPARYKKAIQYQKVNTRFGWIATLTSCALLAAMWFGRGFALLDHWLQSWQLPPVLTGLFFIGALGLLMSLVSMPFAIYRTFVIEERFGFNRTTWTTFVTDRIKGLAIALLLGTPLLAGVLLFFEHAGTFAWIFCWLASILYMLFVQYIAPAWIMPLFNKFRPLESGDLLGAIVAYARSIQFPLKNVFVMDGSRRSAKTNAFFTGFGRNKRIVLFDTLIDRHSQAELLAVLAHEMGHYRKKHIFMSLAAGFAQTGLMFFLLSLLIQYPGLSDAFFVQTPSNHTGLVFFTFLYAPIRFFTGLLMRMLSRRNEYAADRFAVETTGDSRALVDALKKLSVQNLSNLLPHRFYVYLNHSHPPVLDRIRAISGRQVDRAPDMQPSN